VAALADWQGAQGCRFAEAAQVFGRVDDDVRSGRSAFVARSIWYRVILLALTPGGLGGLRYVVQHLVGRSRPAAGGRIRFRLSGWPHLSKTWPKVKVRRTGVSMRSSGGSSFRYPIGDYAHGAELI
jgi:hypothetical protein